MGFVFVDGFDHYTAMPGSAGAKWDVADQVSRYSIDASGGRFSTPGLKCIIQASDGYLQKNFTNVATTIYVGFAYKTAGLPSASNTSIISFMDGSTVQCALGYNATGALITTNGPTYGGSLLRTTAQVLTVNTWRYIEMKITFADAGIFQIWVDGVEWLDATATDTLASGVAQTQGIRLCAVSGAVTTHNRWYDDLYLHNSARQGDVRIIYRAPEAAGAHSEWTPSTGDNFECVNEAAPATADYVETDVLDEIDTYEMTDIDETAGTVLAVVGNYYCQKTDAGARQIAMATELPSSPSEHLVSDGQAVPSSWGYLQFIQETKPGGGAWTVQDTKDAEMGMKLTA
jgi:hypothetical protein